MKQFNLAEWALKHKSIIYYFMAVLLTFGIFSFTHMGRMEDPDFTMRTMVVGVAWPGASPQEMSDQVTDKLEEKLRDLPGVDYTKSFTDGSKSVIYINLKENLPSDKIRPAWEEARNMINDEWKSLPAGVQGPPRPARRVPGELPGSAVIPDQDGGMMPTAVRSMGTASRITPATVSRSGIRAIA